jgi:hypothetical protein
LAIVAKDPFLGILLSFVGLGRPYLEGVVGGFANIGSAGIAGKG